MTNVEQLLEQWRKELEEYDSAVQNMKGTMRDLFMAFSARLNDCVTQLDSSIQRDKAQS